jgi:hypothetical protein
VHAHAASLPLSDTRELQAVELVRALHVSPLLSRATTTQLLTLASIARRVEFKPGVDVLASLPAAMVFVLSGSARVQQDGFPPDVVTTGDVVGMATALGGQPTAVRVEGISDGAAIYFTRTEMFELLADHSDLLQAVYSGLLKAQTRFAVV